MVLKPSINLLYALRNFVIVIGNHILNIVQALSEGKKINIFVKSLFSFHNQGFDNPVLVSAIVLHLGIKMCPRALKEKETVMTGDSLVLKEVQKIIKPYFKLKLACPSTHF